MRKIIDRYGSIVQTLSALYPEVTFAAEKFARIKSNFTFQILFSCNINSRYNVQIIIGKIRTIGVNFLTNLQRKKDLIPLCHLIGIQLHLVL